MTRNEHAPWWASFRRVYRIDYANKTINRIQRCSYNCTMHYGRFDVFDCCVGVGLPLLTIYRAFQHDTFAGPCALINLILYFSPSRMRGTVQSAVAISIRIRFASWKAASVWNVIAHGLVHGHPAENSTAIVRGKWPLNAPGHAEHRLFIAFCRRSNLYQKRLATLQLHSLIIPLIHGGVL